MPTAECSKNAHSDGGRLAVVGGDGAVHVIDPSEERWFVKGH